MSRIVFVLLAVLVVFSASSPVHQCGLNEEFKSCGILCEPGCNKPIDKTCSMQCVVGCQCKGGYLRNGSGICIPEIDC